MGFIDNAQLSKLAQELGKSTYGQYLQSIAREDPPAV
jgi:dTDP-glucose pyrophosphorylase